jgi:hypothetical protein
MHFTDSELDKINTDGKVTIGERDGTRQIDHVHISDVSYVSGEEYVTINASYTNVTTSFSFIRMCFKNFRE